MSTEITTVVDGEGRALDAYTPGLVISLDEAAQRLRNLKRVQAEILEYGVDYAIIPGADKPSLHKPGAEKLIQFHGLAHRFERVDVVEDWERPIPFFQYTYRCVVYKVRLLPDGTVLNQEIASREATCNSREDKYAWRWMWPEEVPADLDKETLRTKSWRGKGDRLHVKYRVPNDDTPSLVNTVMQMAQKRAMVQATLAAVGASGLFTDDTVEDLEEAGLLDGEGEGEGEGQEAGERRQPRNRSRRGRGRRRNFQRGEGQAQGRGQGGDRPADSRPPASIPDSPRVGLLQKLAHQQKRLHLTVDKLADLSEVLFEGKRSSKDLNDGQIRQLAAMLASVPDGTADAAGYLLTRGHQ